MHFCHWKLFVWTLVVGFDFLEIFWLIWRHAALRLLWKTTISQKMMDLVNLDTSKWNYIPIKLKYHDNYFCDFSHYNFLHQFTHRLLQVELHEQFYWEFLWVVLYFYGRFSRVFFSGTLNDFPHDLKQVSIAVRQLILVLDKFLFAPDIMSMSRYLTEQL
jgi:hypothetical protein